MDSRSLWLPQRKRRASRTGGPTWEDVSAEEEEEATEVSTEAEGATESSKYPTP
jgi:hypothetical protein